MLTTLSSNEILNLILNNIGIANLGDATGVRPSSANGSMYLSLHTADPGVGGDQTTSEATYGSYARVAMARDNTKWTVASEQATNAAIVTAPTPSSGTNTLTWFGVGYASAGAGHLFQRGLLSSPILAATGTPISFAIGSLILGAV